MVQKHHNDPDNHDKMRYLPIVDSSTTMNLMYMIKIEELKDYCELYFGFKGDNEPGIGIQLTQHQPKGSPMKMPNPKKITEKLLEHNIQPSRANSVLNMISETGNNPARAILTAMRHIPPLVIYEDSPISYMAEGQA